MKRTYGVRFSGRGDNWPRRGLKATGRVYPREIQMSEGYMGRPLPFAGRADVCDR